MRLVSSSVIRVWSRHCSSTSPVSKTKVVFLHLGQPRTEFYAKEYLNKAAIDYYHVPNILQRWIPSSLLVNGRVGRCIEEYGKRESIEDTVANVAGEVCDVLNEWLPEFGYFSSEQLFLYDSEDFSQQLIRIAKESDVNRIVLFPLYSHFSCRQAGFLLNAAATALHNNTLPLENKGAPLENHRIVPGTDKSFIVSTVHRWSTHPVVSSLWSSRLNVKRNDFDAILFMAPALRGYGRKEYDRSVWSTCERISDELEQPVPWRLAHFNSWSDWPLPLSEYYRLHFRRLKGKPSMTRRVALVPITDMLPSFDNFAILPRITSRLDRSLFIEPEGGRDVMIQGLAEVAKNHLLGRRNPQLVQYCDMCVRKDCQCTRLLL